MPVEGAVLGDEPTCVQREFEQVGTVELFRERPATARLHSGDQLGGDCRGEHDRGVCDREVIEPQLGVDPHVAHDVCNSGLQRMPAIGVTGTSSTTVGVDEGVVVGGLVPMVLGVEHDVVLTRDELMDQQLEDLLRDPAGHAWKVDDLLRADVTDLVLPRSELMVEPASDVGGHPVPRVVDDDDLLEVAGSVKPIQ